MIHGISLPPGQFGGPSIDRLFTNSLPVDDHPYFATLEGLRVSSHLLIRRSGELVQYVPFAFRAWHAGLSSYRGVARCNDYSIGIELEGADLIAYDERQYSALERLLPALCRRYPAVGKRIAGHADIAPGRKSDPGPAFDWSRVWRAVSFLNEGVDVDGSRNQQP